MRLYPGVLIFIFFSIGTRLKSLFSEKLHVVHPATRLIINNLTTDNILSVVFAEIKNLCHFQLDESKGDKLWLMLTMMDRFLAS